ncbi:hypothetical protein RUM44_005294 [Polyplax serrata]|uniref:Tubulin-specific chaperone D n=1 Tax=Polyplax serrata TaxID=468196 RepID=A0ABR1AEM7_POLSC
MVEEENEEIPDEKETDNPGLGCALEFFAEYEEVLELIEKLKEIHDDEKAVEVNAERFVFVLDQYQEQPHLLDRNLDVMLGKIIEIVRVKENPESLKSIAFQYIKHIMKVRGFKTVVRHLPHEVADLEPVLQLLESQEAENRMHWETSYVLLLWMSIIVKIPFHMSRLDSFQQNDKHKTVIERVLNVCKSYIQASSYFMIPAGFLTSHYVTRSDIKDYYLKDFLQWLYKEIQYKKDSNAIDQRNCLNSLVTLAAILKHGKRADLIPFAPEMLQKMLDSNYKLCNNSLLRKYAVKVVQRIGLIFLKPKVAAWRYQRGNRSLAENLKGNKCQVQHGGDINAVTTPPQEREEFDVPEEVEEVIELLMQALKDSDTVIRWSAAKGIGRITGRLPKDLADEVVGTVLELLNPMESDGAWHGGCLTLAELGRRGLLLPQRLPVVVPLILKALIYEDSRGYYSIGDHVRDAACYVAWSFARAYDAQIIKPFVNAIANGLLAVTLFDREIKCRRAASAAFQENVGRQGTFPHGIEIVTTADYFSVGIRQNSFLKISVFVAQFEEYTIPLINHLVEKKVDHWDVAIRELTASALHNLTPLAPDYVSDTVLPALLKKTKSIDLNCRHGSVISIGEIVYALKLLNREIQRDILDEIVNLIYYYKEKRYFSSIGGEILRQGFCSLIQRCSLSKLPIHGSPILDELQSLMDECLISEVPAVRAKAVAALPSFFEEYYQKEEDGQKIALKENCNKLIAKYINELLCWNQTARLGYAMAIGDLPKFMILGKVNELISALLESLKITEYTLKWAESRRDSIKALVSIVSTVGLEALYLESEQTGDLSPNTAETSVATTVANKTMILPRVSTECRHLESIFQNLLIGLAEYTNDTRGDIGAWVREASMSGLEKMVIMTAKWNKQLLNESLMVSIIGGIAQQAVERIDRTRFHAGNVFSSLLHHKDPEIPNIPYRDELLQIFPAEMCEKDSIWRMENETFPKFVRMLSYPCYTHNIMEGLILSVGGLTERLSIKDSNEMNRILTSILDIFVTYLHNIRVIVPLFTFLDRLLGSGVIRSVLEDNNSKFAEELFRLSKIEIARIKDYRKLVNSMDVFCQLVQVKGPISTKALSQMSVFLCHRLKAVRKGAAGKLYECLLLYGDCSSVPEENLDEVMTVLSDTNWEMEQQEVRPIRNKLCELMNVPVPVFVAKKNDSAGQ